MLELNSYVIYGDNGVCLVADKRKEKFAGVIREYYILKPQGNEGSTLFVPADNEEIISKMRSILSKEQILDIIHSLPGEKLEWEEDNKVRGEYYNEVFEKGEGRTLLLRGPYGNGPQEEVVDFIISEVEKAERGEV